MRIEVNGKSVKFCNGWRGVQGGINDYNSGELLTTDSGEMYGATVYLALFPDFPHFQYAICDKLLTREELMEAERMLKARIEYERKSPQGLGALFNEPGDRRRQDNWRAPRRRVARSGQESGR